MSEEITPQESITQDSSSVVEKDWKVEHDNAQTMIGKQANTIGDLRKELEKYKTSDPTDTPPSAQETTTENKPKEDNKPSTNLEDTSLDNLEKVAEDYKLDFNELSENYYSNNGKLSDEMREKIIKSGVPEQFVDSAIAGLKATADEEYAKVAEAVGSPEELNAVFQWLAQNNPDKFTQVQQDFKHPMSLFAAQSIVKGLQAEMHATEGQPASFLKNTGGGTGNSAAPFESRAQVVEYLSDPKAKTNSATYDPAYVKAYNARIAASRRAGIDLGL